MLVQRTLASLHERLAPIEDIFFTWLMRVIAAATLVGTAWIDDAPPLEIAALIVAVYVAVRTVAELGLLITAAPFNSRVLNATVAVSALVLLGFSFVVIAIFTQRLAISVTG
jgi:hypothetical protein